MDKLYTTKEISDMYNIPQYTITQNWLKKGLKHIRGAKNSYLYKKQWIEDFLEEQVHNSRLEIIVPKVKVSRCKRGNIQYVT